MTVATLPDSDRITSYDIEAATTGPLDIGFDIWADGTDYAQWIEVWLDGEQLTAVTDFTVDSPSGSLATLARPITDGRITFTAEREGSLKIVGAARPRRTTQFTSGAAVTADNLNRAFTNLMAMGREGWDRFQRTVRVKPGDTISALPSPEAGTVIGWTDELELDNVHPTELSGDFLTRLTSQRIVGRILQGVGDAQALTASQVKQIIAITVSEVLGLTSALDGKAAASHTHDIEDIEGL